PIGNIDSATAFLAMAALGLHRGLHMARPGREKRASGLRKGGAEYPARGRGPRLLSAALGDAAQGIADPHPGLFVFCRGDPAVCVDSAAQSPVKRIFDDPTGPVFQWAPAALLVKSGELLRRKFRQ